MSLILKAALTLGIATVLGSGVLVEAPAANAQVKIEVNIIEGPVLYRDYLSPYAIDYPGYQRYYRNRRPDYYVRYRSRRNDSRLRYPVYKRSDYSNRQQIRIAPRFNTRDFHHRGW